MKRTTILYVGLALGWLTACSESEPLSAPTYTVGAEDNPIRLQAGIGSLPSPASTRAQANHTALKKYTDIALRVHGKWTGRTPDEDVIKYRTATAGTPSGEYNDLSFDSTLYWDDYGTADPNNTANRSNGLNIYGAAVDGEYSVPDPIRWDIYPWYVNTDGKEVLKKDLLVGKLNLRFDSRNTDNRIDLKHVLSKITINLTAGAGFLNGQFDNSPTVTLTGKDGSGSGTDYALTSGTVNLLDGKVSSTTTSTAPVPMQVSVADDKKTATAIALLFPESKFAESDEAIVAKVVADGNIYYIKAKELREAINTYNSAGGNHKVGESPVYHTLSGFHYVIHVKVNKTKIDVTASIQDWEKIESAEVQPVVNVDAVAGNSGNTMIGSTFDLYYCTKSGQNFSFNSTDKRTVNKDASTWKIDGEPIYWPTHTTHYFFRGITALTDADASASVTLEGMASGNPYVTVTSGPFDQYNSPSNLLMGKPETGNADCGSTDHTPVNMEDEGICARTTPIGLTFKYMMAQVEVVLSTEETSSKKVHLDEHTKVEITNCYTTGNIYLGSMEAKGTGSRDLFKLNAGSDDKQRLSVILPQDLTYTEDSETKNLQFKVTVYKSDAASFNNDDIDDIYYADIAPIKKQGSDDKVAPHGKWESGVHYVYHLKVLKSGVEVVAKLDDWVTASSDDEEVWL